MFFFPLCFPMDPLLRPEFLLLLLEQEDRSLEDHTRLFRFLANTTSYPDDALCSFYDASLNTVCRALSSEDGPREDFAAFAESSSQFPKRMISPDPLQTQSPAHHLPTVRSISPSPPMTESHFPPRSASQCEAERLSG